mmetsp:Transcript_38495/g.78807  ORF Transcript_38495/g.78807 Transcript_38495/m.78807 type:complete len:201 (-) Transcript_38495:205-807(-)
MGNLSLKYIYPSFNQMLGSMSPLITVLLAVVMQQKHFPLKTWLSMPVICVGCSLQREGAQLQCARCVLRQRSYRASSGEISHSRKAPVHLPPDGFCNSAVLHGSVGSHVANFDYVIHGGRRALVLVTGGVRPTRVGARWRRRRNWRRPSAFPPDAFRLERMPSEHCKLSGNLLHQPCHSPSSWQCQELSLHCCVCGDFQE